MHLEPTAHSRTDRRILLAVFALAVAVHLPNLWNGFAWDDGYLIVRNQQIHSLANAPDWFTEPWSSGALGALRRTQNAHFWRPIVQASYAIDWAISGGEPWLFHVTNDLLHGLASVLVALLAFALCVRTRLPDADPELQRRAADFAALAAGAVFAVHPVHSEAVNLACYRTTLLASCAVLGALLLHVRRTRAAPMLVPVLFALGLLGKESAIVLPGLAFVCDLALGRVREQRWRLARRYAGMLAVAVAFLILHGLITTQAHWDYLRGASPFEKLLTMLSVLALYARLLVVPYPLTPFYDWSLVPIQTDPTDPRVLAGLAIAVSLLGIFAWGVARRRPIPILVIGLLLVPLAPYSHIVPFSDVAGERFLYLASAGACIGVGFAVRHAVTSRRRVVLAAVGAVALGYAVFTPWRATHFESTHSLTVATARMVPESFNAQHTLGQSFLRRGEPERAIEPLRRAHEIYPDLESATLILAEALDRAGRRDEAIELLRSERNRLSRAAPASYTDALRALGARD